MTQEQNTLVKHDKLFKMRIVCHEIQM